MGTFQQRRLYSAISFPVPCLVCFSSSGSCHCNEQEQLWFPVSAGHQHASHHTSKGKNNLTRSITSVTTEHQPSLKYSSWTISNWSSTMQENCSCQTSQRGEEASDQFPVLQTAKLHKTVFKTWICVLQDLLLKWVYSGPSCKDTYSTEEKHTKRRRTTAFLSCKSLQS